MLVAQMRLQPTPEVSCQSDVIEFLSLVESVDTVAVSCLLSKEQLILGQRGAGDSLQILRYQRASFCSCHDFPLRGPRFREHSRILRHRLRRFLVLIRRLAVRSSCHVTATRE